MSTFHTASATGTVLTATTPRMAISITVSDHTTSRGFVEACRVLALGLTSSATEWFRALRAHLADHETSRASRRTHGAVRGSRPSGKGKMTVTATAPEVCVSVTITDQATMVEFVEAGQVLALGLTYNQEVWLGGVRHHLAEHDEPLVEGEDGNERM